MLDQSFENRLIYISEPNGLKDDIPRQTAMKLPIFGNRSSSTKYPLYNSKMRGSILGASNFQWVIS
jgi:hypothetical protein